MSSSMESSFEQNPKFPYAPLGHDELRLLTFLPSSTRDDIHCRLVHHAFDFKDPWTVHSQLVDESTAGKIEHNKQASRKTDDTQAGDPDTSAAPIPSSVLRYAALSYCWGNPTPVATITLNDVKFNVARNLHEAIIHLLDLKNVLHFWIDAICLNQSDRIEKGYQVGRMWRIYANAYPVISWLGLPDQELKTAFGFLGHCFEYPRVLEFISRDAIDDFHDETLGVLEAFARTDYFQRAWIMQEVHNAQPQRHIFASGGLWSPANIFYQIFRKKIQWVMHSNTLQGLMPLEIMIVHHLTVFVPPQFDNQTLMQDTLLQLRQKACSDMRDKFFMLAGMPVSRRAVPQILQRLTPDYSLSLNEVVTMTISFHDSLVDKNNAEQHCRRCESAIMLLNTISACSDFTFDPRSLEFTDWLKSRVVWDASEGRHIMRIASGKQLDCSGFSLQALLFDPESVRYHPTSLPIPEHGG